MITKTKTMQFDKLIPDFKRFIKGNGFRANLENVYFDGNYFYVTDSHVLLKLNASYFDNIPFDKDTHFNPKTLEKTDLRPIHYDQMIPNYNNTTIDINDLKQLRDSVNFIHDKIKNKKENDLNYKLINFSTENNVFKLSSRNKDHIHTLDFQLKGDYLNQYFDIKKIKSILTSINKFSKLTPDTIKLNFTGEMKPLVISQGDLYQFVVMPCRVY